MRVAYVGCELTSVVVAFAVDAQSGALTDTVLGIANSLDGQPSGFLRGAPGDLSTHSAAAGAWSGGSAPPSYDALLDSKGRGGRGGVLVCSDAQTSIAAVRVSPDASHVLISNRLVGGPGALSALPLAVDGTFLTDAASERGAARITGILGRTPRDFVVLGELTTAGRKRRRASSAPHAGMLALVASQDDDTLTLLCEGQRAVRLGAPVPSPVCMVLASKA